MKKTLFIILALCSMSYGLSGYSLYKTYVAKDTVTHINLDSNFYRGVNWSNKLADTIDRNFIRWYDFNSHDSTLRYFKVDTIRSNPNIDSITGNVVIVGAPTITSTLTVDSLKSTKGINTTGGTFSGRVTVSDIDASDSVKGVTGTFSGAITGETVYAYKNIAAYNAASSGTYIGLYKSLGSLSGEPSGYHPVIKTDNRYMYFDCDSKYVGYIGVESFSIKDTATSTSVFDVKNDTTTMHIANVDSIKIGTGSYLKNYVEGSFPCTLKTSDVTVQQVGTAYYTKIGNVLTVSIPKLIGTSNSNTLKLYCRFPYKAKLTDGITDDDARSVIVNNNGPAQGMVEVPEWEGYIPFSVGVSRTGFATSGAKGIYAPFTISYITE